MASAVLEGLALREAREQARIEEMAEVDESQFMTAYVSPDDDEDLLPEMEGLDTTTVAEVAPATAAAITPVAEPEVVEPVASAAPVAAAAPVAVPEAAPVAAVEEPVAAVEAAPTPEPAAAPAPEAVVEPVAEAVVEETTEEPSE